MPIPNAAVHAYTDIRLITVVCRDCETDLEYLGYSSGLVHAQETGHYVVTVTETITRYHTETL